ncbi:MAG: hypothetical protein JNJ77_19920 [Planctomycetia bacterium]|nr:hypothetical protein [Planctomycetia bacterium]
MPTTKQQMTPDQSKEHLDQLLELRLEASELGVKASKAHEVYKDAKEKFELKEKEIQQHLEELNQELPLFDKPEEVPFPFPLPDGVADATLANVAADPVVLGLSIGIVKTVRDEINCFTLGQLQHFLNAKETLSPDKQKEAKLKLGKRIGPNAAWKLFRAVASYTGSRKKTTGKKADPVPAAAPAKSAAKTTTSDEIAMGRDTLCADVEELTPTQAQFLAQFKMTKVGEVLDWFDRMNKERPDNPPKDYLVKRVASACSITDKTAKALIDSIYKFEEKYLTGGN